MDIICINAEFSLPQKQLIPIRPELNKVYSVRDLFTVPNWKTGKGTELAVHLNEIKNPPILHPNGLGTYEPSFSVNRFTTLNGETLTKEMFEDIKKSIEI